MTKHHQVNTIPTKRQRIKKEEKNEESKKLHRKQD